MFKKAACLLTTLIIITLCCSCTSVNHENMSLSEVNHENMSLSEFEQLSVGMPKASVDEIVGGSGAKINEFALNGYGEKVVADLRPLTPSSGSTYTADDIEIALITSLSSPQTITYEYQYEGEVTGTAVITFQSSITYDYNASKNQYIAQVSEPIVMHLSQQGLG